MDLIFYLIVFLIALVLSSSEILFGKYALNFHLVLKSPKYLFLYGLFYGSIGLISLYLIEHYELKINDIQLNQSPLITALVIGITIKSISRMNLYTIPSGDKDVHIGFKQISKFFDNITLKRLNDSVDKKILIEVKRVKKKLNQKSNGEVDRLIAQSLPTNYSEFKKVNFLEEIKQLEKFEKLVRVSTSFGVKKLEIIEELAD